MKLRLQRAKLFLGRHKGLWPEPEIWYNYIEYSGGRIAVKSPLKAMILLTAAVFILALSVDFVRQGNMAKEADLEKDVTRYLVDEKGCKPEDIKHIWGGMDRKTGMYAATVIFKDEPGVKYTYFRSDSDGRITFGGYSTDNPDVKPKRN